MPASSLALQLHYRPELGILVARWTGEVDAATLRAGYQQVLLQADEHACPRWLLDVRRREQLSDAATDQWMTQVFLPQLAGRYERRVRLAYLASPLRAAAVQGDSHLPTPTKDPAYRLNIFTDEAAAYRWLGVSDS